MSHHYDHQADPLPMIYPLAHYQRGIWLGAQSRPEGSDYNMVYPLRIRSALQVDALRQALQRLVDRHTILRTTYSTMNGEPVQRVQPWQAVSFQQMDGAHWSPAQVQQWADTVTREPYDLAQGPLFRACLLTCAPADHLLLLLGHHIGLDMISWWTLLEELAILYQALAAGEEPLLPILEKTYHDFVAWHQAELAAKEDRLWRYWQARLIGAPAVLELPTDRSRPALRSVQGATATFCLPDALSAQLRQLAVKHSATLYTTLLAAYQVLLGRLSGQTDLVVGTPFATRPSRALRHTVGLFADLVPLRTDLSGNPTFCALLGQVSQAVVGALAHQSYPFYKLLERLSLKQDPSYTPLFQVTFQLERTDQAGFAEFLSGAVDKQITWAGLTVETYPVRQQEGRTDLALIMYDNGQSLFGALLYDTALFDVTTIQRFIGHFQTLLQGVVTDPTAPIATLPLLTAAERRQLLVDWNATATDYPSDKCFHHLFEEQVARTPDAVAVIFGAQQLTYRELNACANQVAHTLIAQGVGSETAVALYMERGLEMVIALLGILKAAGAYVPLDTAYPPERLAFMVADAQVKILLTQSTLLAQLSVPLATQIAANGVQPLCIDSPEIGAASQANPIITVQPSQLAYIIYTSGSTGQPKGVLIEHQGLANLVEMERRTFNPQPGDRVLQFASFGFDASVWDLIMALMTGATLCVASQEERLSPTALAALLRREAITIATLTPSLLALLSPADFPALQVITATGEACPAEIVARWAPTVRFFNGYGPTEATVGATLGECFADGRKPHIGRPFLNQQIYLLDEQWQPVPIGVPGALYIGGVGLARGYLNRPDLTTAAFIANPFGAGKLYRTGDYARYLPDGNLDFIGRRDQQIKLRGLRIELGEIEAMLRLHPAVQEAVVVAYNLAHEEPRLVAYVTGDTMNRATRQRVASSELRDFLKQQLPSYMIPSAFIFLEALPLNTNGKVDRNALPAPTAFDATDGALPAPPCTPTEVALAGIWSALLGIAQIGIHDDFFALGGHSLLATQVNSRITESFAIELPLRTIFTASTIAELAEAVDLAQLSRLDDDVLLQLLDQNLDREGPPFMATERATKETVQA